MGIGNFYKSIKGGVGKASGSLSDFFSGKETYVNPLYENPAPRVQAPPVQKQLPPAQKYALASREAEFSDDDFEKMKPLIYGEVSNRDYGKKSLEADVIMNTAINRQREYRKHGQDRSIADIVAMPNQYQAYGGDQYKNYSNPQNPVDAAKKQEVDAIVDAIAEKIRKGEYVDNTEGAFYYVHEDDNTIKYDNLRKLFR